MSFSLLGIEPKKQDAYETKKQRQFFLIHCRGRRGGGGGGGGGGKISSPSLFLSISSLVRSHVPVRQHRDIELYVQNSKIRV